ncbi:MAG: hypothetical protein KF713_10675 [Turneriella sp.]|nr:hypothetical protein [Turneriella sp.]
MNYPIQVKKAFSRIRYSAHDIWQNIRDLKRNISSLVRNIDNVGECVSRNRQLLQGLPLHNTGAEERGETRRSSWTSYPVGDQS